MKTRDLDKVDLIYLFSYTGKTQAENTIPYRAIDETRGVEVGPIQ